MKTEMVSYTWDTLPRPTEEEMAAMKRRAEDPNFKIDTSDIPVWTEEQWRTAVRGGIPRTAKG